MTWEVAVYNQEGHCLGSFLAHKLEQANPPGVVGTLQVFTGAYKQSGVTHSVKVYTDDRLYAQWEVPGPYNVYAGTTEKDSLVHIHAISLVDRPVEKVCTCGGWAVYGKEADIHADNLANTCELRMK